jgi:hypothetical protein
MAMGIRQSPLNGSAAHSRPRSAALTIALWTFGMATSLFLIGMWGRTVAVDTGTIDDSVRTIIDSDIATDRINTWFEEGLTTAVGIDSETAGSVARAIESKPEYQEAVDAIIAAFVDSLFAAEGDTTRVDLERTLLPLVPVVADELALRDVSVEEEQIEEALDDAGVVELDAGEAASVAAVVSDARVFLTQVVLASLLGMLLAGIVALFLAPERWAMVRQLSTRVLIAALSYSLVLQLAGWALDPSRGRSPISGAAGTLFSSNAHVFLVLGGLAGCVAAFGYWFTLRRRDPVPEYPMETADDDTREMLSV